MLIVTTTSDIVLQGIGEYAILNTTVCNIAPYVNSVNMSYSQGKISAAPVQNIQPFQNGNMNVASFISKVMWRLSNSSQTMDSNPLGEQLKLSTLNTTRTTNEVLVSTFCYV